MRLLKIIKHETGEVRFFEEYTLHDYRGASINYPAWFEDLGLDYCAWSDPLLISFKAEELHI